MKNKHLVILSLVAILVIDLMLVLPQRLYAAANGLLQMPQIQGQRDQGTSVQGFPVLIGGSDGTNVQNVSVDTSGKVNVNSSGPAPPSVAPTYINVTSSNGTTAVVLVTATAAKQVFPLKLFIANTSATVSHTVTLQSATTTTRAIQIQLPVSASFAIDGDISLSWGTISGEGLNFKIDAGGAAADVTVSGSATVQ